MQTKAGAQASAFCIAVVAIVADTTMLPRDERLPTAEFTRVWESGVHLRHALLSARALRHEGGGPGRCAFVVPRKSGKASERNRIRRRVRECFRLSEARKKGTLCGHSVIFLVNTARAGAPAAEWTQAFEELAPRIVRESRRREAQQETGSPVKAGPGRMDRGHTGRGYMEGTGAGPRAEDGGVE